VKTNAPWIPPPLSLKIYTCLDIKRSYSAWVADAASFCSSRASDRPCLSTHVFKFFSTQQFCPHIFVFNHKVWTVLSKTTSQKGLLYLKWDKVCEEGVLPRDTRAVRFPLSYFYAKQHHVWNLPPLPLSVKNMKPILLAPLSRIILIQRYQQNRF